MSAILTLNAGSSSIKFGVYSTQSEPELMLDGQVENLGSHARLEISGAPGPSEIGPADHTVAVQAILGQVETALKGLRVAGIGHRIVHGGSAFAAPAILNDQVMAEIETLAPMAPLHQPHNLSAIRASIAAFPDAIQVGCFDTAFHKGHPFVSDTFALPRRFHDAGVRRYGFHGLSYDYISGVLARDWPDLAHGRVVVAHLGNGASMCAVQRGQSVASTMGFSALDGLPMGTRCGQLDPGVLLYFLDEGMSRDEIAQMLYEDSGLKGLSGLTHDMRTLLASDAPHARQAIDYYVFHLKREIGAMAAIMGGLDGVVFCGGVGENAPEIRARVIDGLAFLGLELDHPANAANQVRVGRGPTQALVIPTDEERVIARAVAARLS